jgi:hypothetical protein
MKTFFTYDPGPQVDLIPGAGLPFFINFRYATPDLVVCGLLSGKKICLAAATQGRNTTWKLKIVLRPGHYGPVMTAVFHIRIKTIPVQPIHR